MEYGSQVAPNISYDEIGKLKSQLRVYEEQLKEKDGRIEKLKEVIKVLAKELR